MADLERSLERYDVLDRIAVGGMAEVFLAKAYGAHGFEKTLAIKKILPELARDPEFEARFIAEAKVAVKLSHTNVVQVLDFGRFGGTLFIAMEYVDGLDLAALLRRYKERGWQVPLPAAFHIAIELARGLDFAHQHGVVHRDVSPSNILLSRAGEVKIADFGIAVAARPHRSRPANGPRKVMGKWRYMSPEQARGEVLDTRSDLFSAAAVMFELFTGEKLFPGDEAEEILRNIQDMPLPTMTSVRPELPARLGEILEGPLARRPADRPQRAALLLRALTELSYESSIVATSLDVAEAVGGVLAPTAPGRANLDAIIRAQLGSGGGGDADHSITRDKRQTAVGTAPGDGLEGTGALVHTVDRDGVSRLELDATTMAAQPRSRRATGAEEALDVAATGSARRELRPELPASAAVDLDRHTQVGPPLDESRPLVKYSALGLDEPSAPRLPRSPAPPTPVAVAPSAAALPPRRRARVALAVVVAASAAAAVAWWITGRTPAPRPAPVPVVLAADAAPPPTTGTLEIDSVPPGASGRVGEVAFGPTPTRVEVPAGQPLKVALELARYQPYVDDRVEVGPGQLVRMRAVMVPAKAILRVRSTPDGAAVTVDGRRLGETPLERADLEPRPSAVVTLAKDGYVGATARVALVSGEVATVERELRPEPRVGTIDLNIDGGWADVYFRGKRIGRAGQGAGKGLRLPVGTQRLRLVNPVSGRERTLDVVVAEDKVNYYSTPL
ncbi:MAG: serine/threonine-protein kinase [Kofleriaceae bacterium]